jgi:hypothetical protein
VALAPAVDVASFVTVPGTLLNTGPVVSTTVIVKVAAAAMFPCESVALHVTVFGPSAKVEPETGVQPEVATASSGSLNETE